MSFREKYGAAAGMEQTVYVVDALSDDEADWVMIDGNQFAVEIRTGQVLKITIEDMDREEYLQLLKRDLEEMSKSLD